MAKRRHWTPGNFVEIPFKNDRYCYGVVTITERLALMDYCDTKKLTAAQIVDLPILFEISVMNYAIGKNGWPLAGEVELKEKFKTYPYNYKKDPINGKYYILDHTWMHEVLASEEECQHLEVAASWEPCHILERLAEHYTSH